MWRDKIIETKKAKGITTKMMSEAVRLPDSTITTILNGQTATPRIDTVLDLGESVGLSPWELFIETTSVIADKSVSDLQDELDRTLAALNALQADYALLSEEATNLRMITVKMQAENELLMMQNKHKDEIIELHNYYKTVINGFHKNGE
jgi:transcriptional regulator with XRE-family HTH domain